MYRVPQSTTQKYVFQTEVIPSIFIPSTATKAHRPANRQPWRLSSCLSVVAVFMTHDKIYVVTLFCYKLCSANHRRWGYSRRMTWQSHVL